MCKECFELSGMGKITGLLWEESKAMVTGHKLRIGEQWSFN